MLPRRCACGCGKKFKTLPTSSHRYASDECRLGIDGVAERDRRTKNMGNGIYDPNRMRRSDNFPKINLTGTKTRK